MSRLHDHKIGKVKEEERINRLKKNQENLKEEEILFNILSDKCG